jgi:hypothetical protein
MPRSSDHKPFSASASAWRAFGAGLAAFVLGAQLLVSGLVVGSMVRAAGEADLAVICTHVPAVDPGSAPDVPAPQKSHDACPACTCAQSSNLVPTLPAAPLLAVLRARSEPVPPRRVALATDHHLHSPYASRAPPYSA